MSYLLVHNRQSSNHRETTAIDTDHGFGHLIGISSPMQKIYNLIRRVAPTRASVMITGESGTGKELVARTIHDYSERANKAFVAINCGAITAELMGSALFGHERGSFTGATQSHQGYFEQASGGTLFLDELPESSPELQIKLLRVLETGKVIPVGGKRQIDVDVRIVVATNRNCHEAIQEGKMREDIYYRLNTFPIFLPPLRERAEDVALLAKYFLNTLNKEVDKNLQFTDKALEYLQQGKWEGNVRHLKNSIHRAFILADDAIGIEHFS